MNFFLLISVLSLKIHDLVGYDPSDMCGLNRKKEKKRTKEGKFHRNEDVSIMGNNNQLYRGRIDTCEQIPLKKVKENTVKTRVNLEQKVDLHIDQFDQSNQKIIDEHLLEYLDWHVQFNEQVFLSKQNE